MFLPHFIGGQSEVLRQADCDSLGAEYPPSEISQYNAHTGHDGPPILGQMAETTISGDAALGSAVPARP